MFTFSDDVIAVLGFACEHEVYITDDCKNKDSSDGPDVVIKELVVTACRIPKVSEVIPSR